LKLNFTPRPVIHINHIWGVLAYIFSLVMVESYANARVVTPLYMINRRWLYDKLLNDLFGMPSYKLGYHVDGF
jgi:hypothetical protein